MEPRKPNLNVGRLSGAGKWVTVSVTTVAAVVGILVNARNLGLTPWLNVGTISFADLAARRVMVTPLMDTLDAVGDTLHLAATVTDEHGSTLAGATLIWGTDDSTIALVDSAGGVVARGPGSTNITATVRELRARARVTVWQRVRSVAISHDTVIRLPEGTSIQLVARALDARGHAVNGRPIKWESADTNIVSVNAGGGATASAPGRTTLTAATDGYSASIAAEVSLTASSIKLASGGDQRGPAGRKLPQPIHVQVLSRGGRPVPEAVVTFTTESDGLAGAETVATDRSGRARTTWTLGDHAGRQHLLVTVGGADTTVRVIAEADPVPANTRIQLVREMPRGPAGSLLPDSVGIRVTDTAGAAAADVPIAWSAQDGGRIESLSSRTDSLGEAWVRWTLGPRAGEQRARIQLGNPRSMPPFTVTAHALALAAEAVELVSGTNQDGRVGTLLKHPIIARLTDRNGNPAPGAVVRVRATAGTVADSVPAADDHGRVQITWTLGSKSGVQTLELVPEKGTKQKVNARARPLEAANVTAATTPAGAAAGRALPKPVTVTVTDSYGNVVPDVQVVFSVAAGVVAPARIMTDARGQAATRWMLGPATGDQVLTATVRGSPAKAAVVVRATRAVAGR